jgi:hypothetical protein
MAPMGVIVEALAEAMQSFRPDKKYHPWNLNVSPIYQQT